MRCWRPTPSRDLQYSDSRLRDQLVYFDRDCEDPVEAGGKAEVQRPQGGVKHTYDGFGNDVYTQCVGHNLAMDLEVQAPVCWDQNSTVRATSGFAETVTEGSFPQRLCIGT